MQSVQPLLRFVVSLRAALLAATCLLGVGPAEAAEPSLAEALAARLKAMECPGGLVGIFPDEGQPQRFALGVADVKSKQPMTLDMHMRVGSVSKPLLAVVVLQLASEGKIDLNEPIAKYVDGVPAGDKITLRMLGKNTSGLFNTIENKKFQYAIMEKPGKQWTPAEIFRYTFDRPSYAPPGAKWRYSNTNAVLLGEVVRKVTGNNYADEVQRRVCQPLGMTETGVSATGKLPEPCPRAYRNGYPDKVIGYGDVFYDVTEYSAAWTGAAGNFYSTLDDLGRAARPLASGKLLDEAGRRELLDWIETGHEGIRYGYLIGHRHGGIGHAGDVPGFNAYCSYFPQQKRSIVVLTNLSNNNDDTMPADELAKVVREHLKQ